MEDRMHFIYVFFLGEARDGVWAEIEPMFICLHFGPSRSYLQFFDVFASCDRG